MTRTSDDSERRGYVTDIDIAGSVFGLFILIILGIGYRRYQQLRSIENKLILFNISFDTIRLILETAQKYLIDASYPTHHVCSVIPFLNSFFLLLQITCTLAICANLYLINFHPEKRSRFFVRHTCYAFSFAALFWITILILSKTTSVLADPLFPWDSYTCKVGDYTTFWITSGGFLLINFCLGFILIVCIISGKPLLSFHFYQSCCNSSSSSSLPLSSRYRSNTVLETRLLSFSDSSSSSSTPDFDSFSNESAFAGGDEDALPLTAIEEANAGKKTSYFLWAIFVQLLLSFLVLLLSNHMTSWQSEVADRHRQTYDIAIRFISTFTIFLVYGFGEKLDAPNSPQEMLSSPLTASFFRKFAKEQMCSENIDFYLQLERAYKHAAISQRERAKFGHKLMTTFVVENAAQQVNLSAKTFAELQRKWSPENHEAEWAWTTDFFDVAIPDVLANLEDIFARFRSSTEFGTMLVAMIKFQVSTPSHSQRLLVRMTKDLVSWIRKKSSSASSADR